MKSGDDRSRRLAAILLSGTCRQNSDQQIALHPGRRKMHRDLLTTTATAALLAASSAQASRIFQEQPCRRTNGSRPFGLPLPKRPRLRATASAALNLAARIALPVIVLNGVSGVASAQDGLWRALGTDWNTPANWFGGLSRARTGTAAFFGSSTDCRFLWMGGLPSAPFNSLRRTISSMSLHVNINGQGVIGPSANLATFNIVSTVGGTPAFDFNDSSSAGTANFVLGQVVDTAGGFNAGFINFTGQQHGWPGDDHSEGCIGRQFF